METAITKEEIFETVKNLDEGMNEQEDGFRPACVLLSSMYMPADEDEIAMMLDFPREEVLEYGKNLRTYGIWKGKELFAEWLNLAGETSGIAFWMDVNVAQGTFERIMKDGRYAYKVTSEGEKRAIGLMQSIARK